MPDDIPFPSPVRRQILQVEIVWTEDGHMRDWAATIRDAIMGSDWCAWPGQILTSEIETLVPEKAS